MSNTVSPFSFFYLRLYFSLIFLLFCCSNFLFYWLIIEFITLLLVGFCFSIFVSRYSYLIMYFLIQSVSSFSLLLFYILDIHHLFCVFLLLKLSMFPFHRWYINVVYRFPSLPFFLVSTLHKIPSFLIPSLFSISVRNFFYVSIPVTVLISSLFILSTSDLRFLLVSSSVGNNSWFILSTFVSLDFFLLYLLVYSLNFYFLLATFSPFTSVNYFSSLSYSPYSFYFWLISISGIPPFPIFFLKAVILYLLSSYIPFVTFFTIFFTFIMVSSYVISTFKTLSYRFSSSAHLFN